MEARAIALALSSRFGAASSFRLGAKEPQEVDTVFGGCFKREVFDRVGLFDERMVRSQDIEFNKRLKKAGGKIYLAPEIVAEYYPQTTLRGFWNHNFLDGFWTIHPLSFGIKFFSLRHLFPLFFLSGLLGLLLLSVLLPPFFAFFHFFFWMYFLVNFFVSLRIALKEGKRLIFFLPWAFFARHFGYGLGSLKAVFEILIPKIKP